MELKVKRCRCCLQLEFHRLDQQVDVDPFFARYGLQVHVDRSVEIPLFDWGLRGKVSKLPRPLAEKINKTLDRMRRANVLEKCTVKLPYGHCSYCEFLAPWYEIGFDQLSDYYAFYLKDEYKQARTSFQPGFAQLGQVMGSPQEAEMRRIQHEEFITPYLESLNDLAANQPIRILDYGGGEGKIIPSSPWVKGDVLDVDSSEHPILNDGGTYDLVQCLHVLEHVGNPHETYDRLLSYCRKDGLIYVEVPVEHPGLDKINAGKLPICHEHINKFSLRSIQQLVHSSPVEPIFIEVAHVDFLHLDGLTPVIRALARKV